jgi:hypothetical protein
MLWKRAKFPRLLCFSLFQITRDKGNKYINITMTVGREVHKIEKISCFSDRNIFVHWARR